VTLPDAQPQPLSFAPLPVWGLRLTLAALFIFGSEVLLWSAPQEHTVIDWLLVVAGQVTLATLMLDVIVRYRMRDLYTVMVAFVGYAVLASLLVNPEATLYIFPDTLLTHVLGANATFGLMTFGLLLALTTARKRRYHWLMLGYAVWVGFYFGVWTRWAPALGNFPLAPISLEMALVYAVVAVMAALLLYGVTLRLRSEEIMLTSEYLKMSVAEMGLVAAMVVVLLMLRALQKVVDGSALVAGISLLALSYAVLWTQQPEKGTSLMVDHLPPHSPSPLWIILSLAAFIVMTVVGYEIPLIDIRGASQFTLMQALMVGIGFVWLPLAASVISIRAIDRYSRTSRW
jgi:hypothetical protein